eukprot:1059055-Prorocentrum_minimum.AAC.2
MVGYTRRCCLTPLVQVSASSHGCHGCRAKFHMQLVLGSLYMGSVSWTPELIHHLRPPLPPLCPPSGPHRSGALVGSHPASAPRDLHHGPAAPHAGK